MDLETINTFADLDESKFAWFASRRELTYALLDRLAAICQPHSGAEITLRFLARVALNNSWLDGGLRVDVRFIGIAFHCQIVLMRDLGNEYEVLKRFELKASYTEFLKLKDDRGIRPFTVREEEAGKNRTLIFLAPEAARRNSIPPREYQLAQEHMAKLTTPKTPLLPRGLPQLKPEVQAALDHQRIRPPQPTLVDYLPAIEPEATAKQTRGHGFGGIEPPTAPVLDPQRSPGVQAAQAAQKAKARAAARPPTPPRASAPSLSASDIDDGWDENPATKKK